MTAHIAPADVARAVIRRISWQSVPAGVAVLGTDEPKVDDALSQLPDLQVERDWLLKECPRRIVALRPFGISRTLIENDVFAMGATLACPDWLPAGPNDHPALVSFRQAESFSVWLAESCGFPITLPAEEQWERAARGDDDREYPWGDTFSTELANTREAGHATTTPVYAHPDGASPFGVLDMAGNAEEWTRTVYAPYPGAPTSVPKTESWAHDEHVTRGGSFALSRDVARCARRHGIYALDSAAVGVRLVLGL